MGFGFPSWYHISVLYLTISTALHWKLVNAFSYAGIAQICRNYRYPEKSKVNGLFGAVK